MRGRAGRRRRRVEPDHAAVADRRACAGRRRRCARGGDDQDTERGASELRAIEAKVQAAAELRPLNAAIASQVDSATLLDLLDNEDWWRPYREEFAVVRVIVGDQVIAARGGPAAGDEAAVVTTARRQLLGSARATRDGNRSCSRRRGCPCCPIRSRCWCWGNSRRAGGAGGGGVAAGRRGVHPMSWAIAAAFGLGGVGLLVTGRKQGRRREPGRAGNGRGHRRVAARADAEARHAARDDAGAATDAARDDADATADAARDDAADAARRRRAR